MSKALLVFCAATSLVSIAAAEENNWTPSAGLTQMKIWPGEVPDAKPAAGPERNVTTAQSQLSGGKPVIRVSDVVSPTITRYPPKGKNTGVAVLVFPGGGYRLVSMDLEGSEICDWLTGAGMTCVLLKYRVPDSGPYPKSPAALEDAQRALGLVRSHAAEWQIDPEKIGVIGFSAGAHLAAALSTHFDQRLYKTQDAADQVSCRPNFAMVMYPGYLAASPQSLTPNPELKVTKETPPTFLLQTQDDNTAHVESSLAYYVALKAVGAPVEMHLFTAGGHGYGLRKTGLPVADWPSLAETWLRTIKMLPPSAPDGR
ncbi:MAG: alpha/beta hydrolase [Bryobacteraceae bacterium]